MTENVEKVVERDETIENVVYKENTGTSITVILHDDEKGRETQENKGINGPKTELQSFQEYATEQMEDWRFFMFIASWLFLMAFNYKNAHWVR